VPVLAGLPPRPLLIPEQLSRRKGKAVLVIIGSYVPKTSAQLAHLQKQSGLQFIEIKVPDLLSDKRESTLRQVTFMTEQYLQEGKTIVLHTSRTLITGADDTGRLHIGQQVSAGLVNILQNIRHEPAYILAKGGITSSDIATQALGIKRALVLGQILPGVPVWKPDHESKFPGVPYIVFPGNVGGPDALSEIVEKLS
jgi:uncharacterized protein YgbK (DUF1537 family)